MEENNNLDTIFRSAAEQMEMKPSESTWDSISSRLEQKRVERNKKRRNY